MTEVPRQRRDLITGSTQPSLSQVNLRQLDTDSISRLLSRFLLSTEARHSKKYSG